MDPFSKTQNYPYLIDYMNRIDMMMRTKSVGLSSSPSEKNDLEEVHKHVFEQQIRKLNKEIHQLKKENGRLRYEIDTYLEEIIQLRKELAFYKDENDILHGRPAVYSHTPSIFLKTIPKRSSRGSLTITPGLTAPSRSSFTFDDSSMSWKQKFHSFWEKQKEKRKQKEWTRKQKKNKEEMKLQATPVSCWKRLFTRSNESPPPPTDEQNPQPSISSSSPTKGPSPIHRTVSSPVLPLPSKHKRHPSPSFSPSPDSYTPVVYSLDSTGSLPTDVISLSHPPPLSSPPLNSSQQRPPHFSNENEEIMNSEILSSFDKRFNVSTSSYKKRHRRSSLDDYILLDSPERLEQESNIYLTDSSESESQDPKKQLSDHPPSNSNVIYHYNEGRPHSPYRL